MKRWLWLAAVAVFIAGCSGNGGESHPGNAASANRLSAGGTHSLAVADNGTVWAWGGNFGGSLGDNTTTQRFIPVQTEGLTGATVIAAGYDHSVARKSDGTVWTWGSNQYCELGNGTETYKVLPIPVVGLSLR